MRQFNEATRPAKQVTFFDASGTNCGPWGETVAFACDDDRLPGVEAAWSKLSCPISDMAAPNSGSDDDPFLVAKLVSFVVKIFAATKRIG